MCHVVIVYFLVLCYCWQILFLVCDLTLEVYASPDFVLCFSSLNSRFEFSSQTACFLRFDVITCTRFSFVGFAFLSVSQGSVFITVTVSHILLRYAILFLISSCLCLFKGHISLLQGSLALFTRSSSILLVARLPVICTCGARELRRT